MPPSQTGGPHLRLIRTPSSASSASSSSSPSSAGALRKPRERARSRRALSPIHPSNHPSEPAELWLELCARWGDNVLGVAYDAHAPKLDKPLDEQVRRALGDGPLFVRAADGGHALRIPVGVDFTVVTKLGRHMQRRAAVREGVVHLVDGALHCSLDKNDRVELKVGALSVEAALVEAPPPLPRPHERGRRVSWVLLALSLALHVALIIALLRVRS